ncbi:hypothetical protein HOA91_02745 [Candidatus Woesearchaeota archaeon]|nr:hypothetical protein [Candidatus Woesearchaeota archaeon]
MDDNYIAIKELTIKHLHALVDLVKGDGRRKVLVHEWVLGICSHWRAFSQIDGNSSQSEFIPRVSIGIQGIRNRFDEGMNRQRTIKELRYVFDISTYCYFEYGAREDVLNKIKDYCHSADKLLGEKALFPMYEKFMMSRAIIPIVNGAIDKIEKLSESGTKTLEKIRIKEEINDASGLEKEFTRIIRIVVDTFFKSIKESPTDCEYYISELNNFVKKCEKLNYENLINNKQKEELEYVARFIFIQETLSKTIRFFRTPYVVCKDINLKTFNLNVIDSKRNLDLITKNIVDIISNQLMEDLRNNPLYYEVICEKINQVKDMWENLAPDFLTKKQISFMEESEKRTERLLEVIKNKKEIKKILEDSFQILSRVDPDIPRPRNQSIFDKIYCAEVEEFNEKEVFTYLFNSYLDIVNRFPPQGKKLLNHLKKLVKDIEIKFNAKYLRKLCDDIDKVAYLEILVKNIFGKGKQGIDVLVYQNNCKLAQKATNSKGIVKFEEIPRGNIQVRVLGKRLKEKEYMLKEYYNSYSIRLAKF